MIRPVPPPVRVAAYELAIVLKFLKSVAIAKVMAQNTDIKWVPVTGKPSDSLLLKTSTAVTNVLYGMAFWKEKAGFYETQIPQLKQVAADVVFEMDRLVTNWLMTIPRGPAASHRYLEQMEKYRQDYLQAMAMKIRSAGEANEMVMKQLASFQTELTVIVAASAVILAASFLYVAVGINGAFVCVTPLGPLIVGSSTASQVCAAGWLCAVGATARGIAQASTTAIQKVGGSRVIEVVGGEVICEKVGERYLTTVEGEERVVDRANRIVEAYERNSQRSLKVMKRIAAQRVKREAAEKTLRISKPVSKLLGAGARWMPILFASHELDESMDYLTEVLDEQAAEEQHE